MAFVDIVRQVPDEGEQHARLSRRHLVDWEARELQVDRQCCSRRPPWSCQSCCCGRFERNAIAFFDGWCWCFTVCYPFAADVQDGAVFVTFAGTTRDAAERCTGTALWCWRRPRGSSTAWASCRGGGHGIRVGDGQPIDTYDITSAHELVDANGDAPSYVRTSRQRWRRHRRTLSIVSEPRRPSTRTYV